MNLEAERRGSELVSRNTQCEAEFSQPPEPMSQHVAGPISMFQIPPRKGTPDLLLVRYTIAQMVPEKWAIGGKSGRYEVFKGPKVQAYEVSMYALNRYQGCDFSHLLTTLGIGHAVDSPLSFVRSYIFPQHSYNLRSWISHLDGL